MAIDITTAESSLQAALDATTSATPAKDLLLLTKAVESLGTSSGGSGGASTGVSTEFVATGTLPNGAPVILKTDGTVEVVAGSGANFPQNIPASSEVVYGTESALAQAVAFDPNNANQFVVVFRDGAKGSAVLGTVSGTSISFGTKVQITTSGVNTYIFSDAIKVAFDPNTAGKFLVCWATEHSPVEYIYGAVGTISGTSLSFGTTAAIHEAKGGYLSMAFDPSTAGQFICVYKDEANSSQGTAVVGTISGTSFSVGSEFIFNTGSTLYTAVAFDPNTAGQFVVAYRDSGNSNYGTAIVGNISGSSITFGSEIVFYSGSCYYHAITFDPSTAGQFVISHLASSDGGGSYVGTISGTSLTFGSRVEFSDSGHYMRSDMDSLGNLIVCFMDGDNSDKGKVVVGTIADGTLTLSSPIIINDAVTSYFGIAFDPNTAGDFVICYKDGGNGNQGTALLGKTATSTLATNLTIDNFIGTSTAAYADGETAIIMLRGGLSTNQTGLTVGATYHIKTDGTLTTTSSDLSVEIGKALTATTLQLKAL